MEELEAARTWLFDWAVGSLSADERNFLLSIKRGEPDWALMSFRDLGHWPAIQWKLHNIRQMSPRAHKAAVHSLREVLAI